MILNNSFTMLLDIFTHMCTEGTRMSWPRLGKLRATGPFLVRSLPCSTCSMLALVVQLGQAVMSRQVFKKLKNVQRVANALSHGTSIVYSISKHLTSSNVKSR
jgi:hypothetical protein